MYSSFAAFIEGAVLPARAASPARKRLDGQLTGGNFDVVGEFRHWGRGWKVHADTRYEPLLLAYEAALRGEEPFVEATTKNGKSLDLKPELHARLSTPSRFKYIYIYET